MHSKGLRTALCQRDLGSLDVLIQKPNGICRDTRVYHWQHLQGKQSG